MHYHKIPFKWRGEVHRYVLEYIQSSCTLSVREYCRRHSIKQGVFKRYATAPMRDWIITTLMNIKSIDEEVEQQLSRLSMKDAKEGVYGEFFK